MHPKTADVIHRLKALAFGNSRIIILEAISEIERLSKKLEAKEINNGASYSGD